MAVRVLQGVGFTDKAGEAYLRGEAERNYGLEPQRGRSGRGAGGVHQISLSLPSDIAFVEDVMAGLKEWLGGCGGQKGRREYAVPACNPFLRLALMQAVAREHPEVTVMSRPLQRATVASRDYARAAAGTDPRGRVARGPGSRGGDERQLFCARLNEAGHAAWARAEAERSVHERLGMRRLWSALAASGVDLVLHNGLYDLLFLYAHFEARLPDTLAEFKARIHLLFPRLIDTKVLAELDDLAPLIPSSSLLPLYRRTGQEVNVAPRPARPVPFAAKRSPASSGSVLRAMACKC